MRRPLALNYTICWILLCYYEKEVRSTDPLDCDFETGFCNWTQSNEDELDWTRISGAISTDDGSLIRDHITGGRDSFYAYIDTSSGNIGNEYRAWLISPSKTSGTYCFSFWYYMYGTNVYTLSVFKSLNGWTHLFQVFESQGKRWILASIDISSTTWLKIVIFGRFNNVDSTNYSIIAIDDISMFPGSCPTECEDPTPTFGSVDSAYFQPGSVANVSCMGGYTIKGKSSITCLANGTWSSQPECHPIECDDPTPMFGFMESIDFKPGSVANISCMSGYTLKGKSSITCLANGTWNGQPECHLIDCLAPNFAHGRVVKITEGTTFNSSLQLACEIGYELQGTAYVTCQIDGNWTTLPTCQIIKCDDPTPVFGVVNSTDFTPGSVSNIACISGYTLTGKSSITCLANGTWSSQPECHQIDCLVPTFANGRIVNISEGTTFNSSLQLACEKGYKLQGTAYVTCQTDGNWTELPTCQIIKCDDPAPSFGSVDTTDFKPGSVANITCMSGYTLKGKSSITCLENGTWSGQPECHQIDCGDPTPMSGSVNSTNFQYKSQIEITCNPGYTLVGNSSIICQENGNWSNTPVCEPIGCFAPFVPNGMSSGILKFATYNQTVMLDCADGYTLSGNRTITCQPDGNWSSLPECLVQESSSKCLLCILVLVVGVIMATIVLIILLCIVLNKLLAKICFRNNTQRDKAELENDLSKSNSGDVFKPQSDWGSNRTEHTRNKNNAGKRSETNMFTAKCNSIDSLASENEYKNDNDSKLKINASGVFEKSHLPVSGNKRNNNLESHFNTTVTFNGSPRNIQANFQEKYNRCDYLKANNLQREFVEGTQT